MTPQPISTATHWLPLPEPPIPEPEPPIPEPEPEPRYVLLEAGTTIAEGDEYYLSDPVRWYACTTTIGRRVRVGDPPLRRPIPNPVS